MASKRPSQRCKRKNSHSDGIQTRRPSRSLGGTLLAVAFCDGGVVAAVDPLFVSPVTGGRLHWPSLFDWTYYCFTIVDENSNSSNVRDVSATRRRHLADGDFSNVNRLFQGATIDIPGEHVMDAGSGLLFDRTFTIHSVQCSQLEIGDILLQATSSDDIVGSSSLDSDLPVVTVLDLEVVNLDFECAADYTWKRGATGESKGTIAVTSNNNDIKTQFVMTSPTTIPAAVTVELGSPCSADLNIDLDSGSVIIDGLVDLAEPLLLGLLESEVCKEIDALADQALPELLDQALDAMKPYLIITQDNDFAGEVKNPLRDEELLVEELEDQQTTYHYIDFQNASSSDHETADMAHFLLNTIDQVDAWLGGTVETNDGKTDLGINVLMRDLLLDDNGIFVWDMTSSQSRSSPLPQTSPDNRALSEDDGDTSSSVDDRGIVLLESNDELLQMTLTLDNIEIQGLDSMTKFDTFDRIGIHTLQNTLAWEYLAGAAAVTIRIAPSTQEDSLWSTTVPGKEILETVTLTLSAEDIHAVVSLFMAIEQSLMGRVPLGALFSSDSVAPCLFSAIYQGHLLSGFNVTVSDLIDPTLTGFSSTATGLQRVLNEGMDLMYNLYEHWMILAMPAFAQTTVRDSLNKMWVEFLGGMQKDQAQACSLVELPVLEDGSTALLDFRDLLLPVDEALAKGSTGSEPYGDFVSFVFELIQGQLLVVDENDPNNRLLVNSMLLAPLTKFQSGEEGTLHFKSDLVNLALNNRGQTNNEATAFSSMLSEIASEVFGYLQFRLYDTKIQNIDTIVAPTYLLQTSDNPYFLENLLKFGPVPEKPLSASVRVLLGVIGNLEDSSTMAQELGEDTRYSRLKDPLPSVVEHVVNISLSASSLEVLAGVVAMVDARKLQSFLLEGITNPYCWLSLMPTPSNPGQVGVKMDAFLADFSNLVLSAQCANAACSEGGLSVLEDLTRIWGENNVTEVLGNQYKALAAELLTGDYADKMINRWLGEASRNCPHDENYGIPAAIGPVLGLPVFSSEAIDTMAFTALVAAQAAFLVLSETSLWSHSESLEAVKPTEMPTSTKRLINFTDTDSSGTMVGFISYLFSQANALLGNDGISSSGNVKINEVISGLLDKNGAILLEFEDSAIIEKANLQLRLNSLRVIGLDTFSEFDILSASAPQLLNNIIALEELAAEIDISVVSGPGEDSNAQNFVLTFQAEDIKASLPIFAAIDADALNELELGALLDIDNILSCIFTAVEIANVSDVNLQIGKITNIAIKGLISASDTAFERSMTAITEQFDIGIVGFLNPIVRAVFNEIISHYKKSAKCENKMLSKESSRRLAENAASPHIDFRDLFLSESMAKQLGGSGLSPYGNLFRSVLSFLQDLVLGIDPATGLSSINEKLIGPLTESISSAPGTMFMSDTIVDTENRVRVGGLDALVTFKVSDARIENLDTMGVPLSLLIPVSNEPLFLNNTATVGVPIEKPLRLSARVLLGLEDDATQMRNDVELSLDLHATTVVLTAMMKVLENDFAMFPLGDILNQDCWFAKIPAPKLDEFGFRNAGVERSAGISELAASVSKMNLDIKCISCTSPDLKSFSTEGSQDLGAVMNRVLDYVTNMLGGKFLQLHVDRALNNAAKRCPHSPGYDPSFMMPQYATYESTHEPSVTFLLMILLVTAVLVAIILLIVLSVRYFVRARHSRLLRSLLDSELYLLQREQKQEGKRERELNAVTHSLFQSSGTIPAYVRFLMPVVIIVNIGFFLSGHLSLGATVIIEAQLAGEEFQVGDFFSFSMVQSTIDIWNAGGKALAALIFIFSGLWPYTKSIATLVLWFTPPSRVCMATRGSTLLWLDTLAKWSMVDIFVLLVSIAGFRISIVSPQVDFLPDNFYSVDLLVVPMWGLYANMIAQLISQISSHAIIHYHRQVVKKASRAHRALHMVAQYLETGDQQSTSSFSDQPRCSSSVYTSSNNDNTVANVDRKDRLCEHAFVRPHSDNSKLVTRSYVNPMLFFGALAVFGLIISGCILPSFSLEVMGILGVLVESGRKWEQAVEEHSVFTIAEMLMDQAEFLGGAGDFIGLGTMSALLLFTVLFVPLFQAIALLHHWFKPMTTERRRKMEILLESTQSWQYVEVYLIATIVASWQLGPISEFMINSYCGNLDDTFDILAYYGILKVRDAQCFRVEASISIASYMLAASAVILALLNTYIGNASRQYFRDVENKSKNAIAPSLIKNIESAPADGFDNSSCSATRTSSFVTVPSLKITSKTVATYLDSSTSCSVTKASCKSYRPGLESPGNSVYGDKDIDDVWKNEDSWDESDPLANPQVAGDDAHWRRSDVLEKIYPIPVLFTDKFRWTLRSQDDTVVANEEPVEGADNTSYVENSEAQSLLMMKGDAPDSLPISAVSEREDGDESSQDEEGFMDEAEFVRTRMCAKNGKWGRVNKYQPDQAIDKSTIDSNDYGEDLESDSDSNIGGTSTLRSVAETERSDFETVGMDQSVGTRASDYLTARDEDETPVLLGSGGIRLEATAVQTNNESFENEPGDSSTEQVPLRRPRQTKKPTATEGMKPFNSKIPFILAFFVVGRCHSFSPRLAKQSHQRLHPNNSHPPILSTNTIHPRSVSSTTHTNTIHSTATTLYGTLELVGGGFLAAAAVWLYFDGADDRARSKLRQEEQELLDRYHQERKQQAFIEPREWWTLEEIAPYDGTNADLGGEDGPILLAADGLVFNVYKGRNFYGPGGEYHIFAGRDATRLLARTIVEEETPEDAAKPLNMGERAALAGWMFTIKNKYEVVGRLEGFDPNTTSMKSLGS